MKNTYRTFTILAALAASLGAAPAQAAPPNAGQMATLSYLLGTWDCTWTAGPASGSLVATFSNVMDGAWIEETEAVQKSGAEVVMTMHFTGYDTAGKRWLHAGPNADGSYEVAQSDDFVTWHSVIPSGGEPATIDKRSNTEYILNEPFTQDGKALTYRNDCKKRS